MQIGAGIIFDAGLVISSHPQIPPGQVLYDTPGTYNWTAPTGVFSVSVVCIGGGGSGMVAKDAGSTRVYGGGGAGLGWRNNIAVVPGQTYTVVVGDGAPAAVTGTSISSDAWPGADGGSSYFQDPAIVAGYGGGSSVSGAAGTGGGYSGDGGGAGGQGGAASGGSGSILGGGGGAGGYSGNGGNAGYTAAGTAPQAGSGGGGGGGGTRTRGFNAPSGSGAGGGGTGVFGQSTSGGAGVNGNTNDTAIPGDGGSGGSAGSDQGNTSGGIAGGNYGGGGHGSGSTTTASLRRSGRGASGAVRIIWAGTRPGDVVRAFPSTNTGNI
jgi:hypothetical protein